MQFFIFPLINYKREPDKDASQKYQMIRTQIMRDFKLLES